jgi:hypothetical protein
MAYKGMMGGCREEFQRRRWNSIVSNGISTRPEDEWHRSEEKRWLELWDKHQAAKVAFVRGTKTRH